MSAPGASASSRAEPLAARRRRYARSHPDWWLGAVAAAAWVGLGVMSAAGAGGSHAGHAHHGEPAHGTPAGPGLAWWGVMAAAMMLPYARPQARWLAMRSLRRHRVPVVALFALAFLLPWLAMGAVAVPALADARGSLAALAGALAVAAAWQASPPRRRLMHRCAALRAPAIHGHRAVTAWARSGAGSGARCVTTCWALMLPMAIVHHPVVMALVAGVIHNERRRAPNADTRGARAFEANILGVAAMAVLLLALVRAGG